MNMTKKNIRILLFNIYILSRKDILNIDELVGQNFSGVVSIRKGKEIIAQNSYGYADKNNKIPNEIDTRQAAILGQNM